MHLLEPSQLSRAAASKHGVVRESNGDVVIEYKGVALRARQFVEDARVSQGAIADSETGR